MAQLIASSASAATSSDFTVGAGESATISLFDADGANVYGSARVELKSSNNTYIFIPNGELNAVNSGLRITAPGTYRVTKDAAAVAFGVDKV